MWKYYTRAFIFQSVNVRNFMITKNLIKKISLLKQKKHRNETQQFIVEGFKSVEEFLQSSLECVHVFSTNSDWCQKHPLATLIDANAMKKMSALTTPSECLGVFSIPSSDSIDTKGTILALDSVRDPGNMGTIIRLCDWFGIRQIICSDDTVDVYNPKVVQATMGSLTRVKIRYTSLTDFFKNYQGEIIGTFMDGKNVYTKKWESDCCIVMGNEANGISKEIGQQITERITIPRFGKLQQTESLNVSMATSIILSECRRQAISEK